MALRKFFPKTCEEPFFYTVPIMPHLSHICRALFCIVMNNGV